ncbi:MAG: DEAD/DEAH box helicase family protein [Candidatus Nanoarchaeia archaeon]|jgi:Fanconi anemia group M protein
MKLLVKPRLYQEQIFATAAKENTLVVLPTGLGKTLIALMMAIHYLPKGKVLIMAPTKPLVEQHLKSFTRDSDLLESDCALITGAVSPDERTYEQRVIFATPQTIRNDIITHRLKLNDFSLLIFDECHRATGNYAYTFIAQQFNDRIIGLSASPGNDSERIKEVCNNLGLTAIEARTEQDLDVKQYLNKKKVININLELPSSLEAVMKHLKQSLSNNLKDLKLAGALTGHDITKVFKRDLLLLQSQAVRDKSYQLMSMTARSLKAMHAIELIETQGPESLKKYFDGLKRQPSRASKELIREPEFLQAMHLLYETSDDHPKFKALLDLIKPDKTQLIFTQYRATAELINDLINNNGGNARLFIGQRGTKGMSQKEQLSVLDAFRNNEFNTLVSTSVSEEGIDIPRIDAAIFFEPVPSALRTVQRRGRVGRAKTGEVYVLITKGTVDEKYKWVAHYKEKRMKEAINNINKQDLVQSSLNSFI